jgi:cytoskeletal protein RodZ
VLGENDEWGVLVTSTVERRTTCEDVEVVDAFERACWAPQGLRRQAFAGLVWLVAVAALCVVAVWTPFAVLGRGADRPKADRLKPVSPADPSPAPDGGLALPMMTPPGRSGAVPTRLPNGSTGPAVPTSAGGRPAGPVSSARGTATVSATRPSAAAPPAVTVTVERTASAPSRTTKPTAQLPGGWLTADNFATAGIKTPTAVRSVGAGAGVTAMVEDPHPGDHAMLRAIGGDANVRLRSLGGDQWAIVTVANGKGWYVETTYMNEGYGVVRAHSLSLGMAVRTEERFRIWRFSGGEVAIQAVVNGQYLAVEPPKGTSYQGKYSYMVRAASPGGTPYARFTLS